MKLKKFLAKLVRTPRRGVRATGGRIAASALTIVGLAALAPPTQAQVTPTTIFSLTNLPPSVPGATTTNLFAAGTIPTNNVISLRQGQGMASAVTFFGASGAAAGFSLNWAVSLDGTNWQTTGFLQNTNLASGTNIVTSVTNYSSVLLNNELFIAPYSLQNANAGAVTVSNTTVSFGNIVPGGYP
jgi:hypothetical protein